MCGREREREEDFLPGRAGWFERGDGLLFVGLPGMDFSGSWQ